MNKRVTLSYFLQFCFAVSIILGFINSTLAQTKENEIDNQPSLTGLTEAVLSGDKPAFRIHFNNNVTSEVSLEKRDGEDALFFTACSIWRSCGKLYITRTKITYVPNDDAKNFFKIDKSKIKEIKFNDSFRLNGSWSNVNIKYDDDEKKLSLIYPGKGDKQILVSANKYLLRAIKNFDSALVEFNQLTASVRQEEETEKIDETEADIVSKYDRFKDKTIVLTSKMLVRGNKRSIRMSAEYNFSGKTQQKPEQVSLYFYASASRPFFQEDNLELNFLVNDKRVPLGKMRLADEEKTNTTTKQTILITMPYETFEQIANGKKVEFQIGTQEYKLTEIQIETFKQLLSYKNEN